LTSSNTNSIETPTSNQNTTRIENVGTSLTVLLFIRRFFTGTKINSKKMLVQKITSQKREISGKTVVMSWLRRGET